MGTGPTQAPRAHGTRTILIVGAAPTTRAVLSEPLGRQGYLVVLADGVRDALDRIAGRGFSLVLLDLQLLGRSALEVLHEIRTTRETSDLPVIAITGSTDANLALAAIGAGADDCLASAGDAALLAARIAQTLARAERLEELKRSNLALDARIAARAIELGEMRSELAATRADRARLLASLHALDPQLARFSPGTSVAG